jgi:alpha-tubulin suppressor-like RCC1 family protein
VVDVAIGERHSCAVTAAGKVFCWGDNNVGQLGVGTTVPSDTAKNAAVQSGATEVVAGINHTCALIGGAVKCWGSHQYGQIGDPSYDFSATVGVPKPVPGLSSGVTGLAAGAHHTCALLGTGNVTCWGRNDSGQIGSGLDKFELGAADSGNFVYGHDDSSTASWAAEQPAVVPENRDQPDPLSNIESIYAGQGYSCALDSNQALSCWGAIVGDDSCGRNNESICSYFPARADWTNSGVAEVRTNNDMELEIDTWHARGAAVVPTQLAASLSINGVAAGSNHMCLLVEESDTSKPNVYCLGDNDAGQLGDGSTNGWDDPTVLAPDVDGNTVRAVQVSAAGAHSCALVGDNNAKCWGSNDNGQIGNSDLQREQSYQPFDVKLNSTP